MRVFLVDPLADPYNIRRLSPFKNIDGASPSESCAEAFALQCLPDTAFQGRGLPLFVPDYAPTGLAVRLALCLRVSRLGRSVTQRFASRYYDAATVCAVCAAPELAEALRARGLPTDVAQGFDGAIGHGSWEPVPAAGSKFSLHLSGSTEAVAEALAPQHARLDEALAFVSRYVKLCQGDALLLPVAAVAARAKEETHVEGFIGEKKVLSFNIK